MTPPQWANGTARHENRQLGTAQEPPGSGDNTPSAPNPRRPGTKVPCGGPGPGVRIVLTNPRKGDRDDSEEKVHTEGQPFAAAG